MILNHRKTIRSVISLPVLKIMFNNRIIHGMSAYPDKLSRQRRFSEDNGCGGTKNRVVVKKTVEKFVSEMIKVFRQYDGCGLKQHPVIGST